jgi:hypothetical protein
MKIIRTPQKITFTVFKTSIPVYLILPTMSFGIRVTLTDAFCISSHALLSQSILACVQESVDQIRKREKIIFIKVFIFFENKY